MGERDGRAGRSADRFRYRGVPGPCVNDCTVVRSSYQEAVVIRQEVGRILIEAIKASQIASGRPHADIVEGTGLADIEGFDSLIALEVLVAVSERVGVEIPDDVLARPTNGTPLSVQQLADRICSTEEPRHVKP